MPFDDVDSDSDWSKKILSTITGAGQGATNAGPRRYQGGLPGNGNAVANGMQNGPPPGYAGLGQGIGSLAGALMHKQKPAAPAWQGPMQAGAAGQNTDDPGDIPAFADGGAVFAPDSQAIRGGFFDGEGMTDQPSAQPVPDENQYSQAQDIAQAAAQQPATIPAAGMGLTNRYMTQPATQPVAPNQQAQQAQAAQLANLAAAQRPAPVAAQPAPSAAQAPVAAPAPQGGGYNLGLAGGGGAQNRYNMSQAAKPPQGGAGMPAFAGGGVVLPQPPDIAEPMQSGTPATAIPSNESGMRRYSPIGPANPKVGIGPKPTEMSHHLPRRVSVTPKMTARLPKPKQIGTKAVGPGKLPKPKI